MDYEEARNHLRNGGIVYHAHYDREEQTTYFDYYDGGGEAGIFAIEDFEDIFKEGYDSRDDFGIGYWSLGGYYS